MALPVGAPCWFELAAKDAAAAKSFYEGWLGWTSVDDATDNGVYTRFQKDGADVGAMFGMPPQMTMPTNWGVYFHVENVDASIEKLTALGGKVMMGPYDAADHGRLVVASDPGGAVFSLWQPKANPGAGKFGEVNTVCWAELATRDVPNMNTFYANLLGWETAPSKGMPAYVEYFVGGQPYGGLLPMDAKWGEMPSHWAIYFLLDDVDAMLAKATGLGASVFMGPVDAPGVGRLAGVRDPQGAAFYVIKLAAQA